MTAVDLPATGADGVKELVGTVVARSIGSESDCSLARVRREAK
jgi:hypothetical protein